MIQDSISLEFLPCQIVRESKLIKFNDTNEIEEDTTYLIELDGSKIEDNKDYIMELPITYFRIPEKTIEEYEDFLEVKSSIELFKKLKLKQELLNRLDGITGEYIQKFEVTEEYNIFKEYLELRDKEKKKVAKRIQEVKELPKVQPFVEKEKYEIKNLSLILNETDSNVLIEKIIWSLIFEDILELKNSKLKNLNQYIQKEIKNEIKETRLKKIKFDKSIKSEIESIDIREFLEESGKFETSINYPHTKRKIVFNHNSDLKMFYFAFLYFSIAVLFLGLQFLKEYNIIFIVLTLSSAIIILGLFKIFFMLIKRKRLMKRDDLLDKFNQTVNPLLNEKEDHLEWDEKKIIGENLKIKLFLDSLTEKLFKKIYKSVFNDLDKCIFDYKSFNPMSIEIIYENEKILFPIKTPLTGFFHKTNIVIKSNFLQNKKFSIKLKTSNIVRRNEKKNKIMKLKTVRPKNIKRNFVFQLIIAIIFIIFYIIQELEIIPELFEILVLSITAYTFSILAFTLFYYKEKYYYNSKLSNLKNIDSKFELNKYQLERNKEKKIYSLPIILRDDCSYYYSIYAPRYHNLKFTEEIRALLNEINIRIPMELSTNILSFNIPRRSSFEKNLEFDIDLEIPLTTSVKLWIFGIFCIISLLFITAGVFLFSIINPTTFGGGLDISSLRFVLTFLTLLIGFFGKDVINNPTKDLYKIGNSIIILSLITGVLFVVPIFI